MPSSTELSFLSPSTSASQAGFTNSSLISAVLTLFGWGDKNIDIARAEAAEQASHQRHLLQAANASFPTTYSTLTSDVRFVTDGVAGFSLQGTSGSVFTSQSVSTGDINGDGITDLIVGATLINTNYVIFGNPNPNAWGNGKLNLSRFADAQNGFALTGNSSRRGFAVSTAAGDINGDGITDLLIGNPDLSSDPLSIDQINIVFGSRNTSVWGNGTVDVSTLMDSKHGFVLLGGIGDSCGIAVGAGDINGDRIPDLIAGASDFTASTGKTYVVFGSMNGTAWGAGRLNISSLTDGQRGFVMTGTTTQEHNGLSVSAGGDVNGDGIADLIIGARGLSSSPLSRTYVIFGSTNSSAWGSGTFLGMGNLINGQRGFILQGDTSTYLSGFSVSFAGDVNGDGISDLIVGAYAVKCYVVFGTSNSTAWSLGTISLSSLMDGQRGFSLQVDPSYTCQSVSAAGDVNGDGVSDLIVGATFPNNVNVMGKSYVVFGSRSPGAWGNGTLILSNLVDSQRGLAFFGVTGYYPIPVSAGDINNDTLSDLIIDGMYNVAYVVFGSRVSPSSSLYFTANNLRIGMGQTVTLTPQNLAVAANQTINANTTYFFVDKLQYGQFSMLSAPTTPITFFWMQNVSDGQVQITKDMSTYALQYRIYAANLQAQNSPFISVYSDPQIVFVGYLPILVSNNLVLNQYETIVIQASNLNATDQDNPPNQLIFTIVNVTYGQFILNNVTATKFSMQDVLDGKVSFEQDGSHNKPSYAVALSDLLTTLPSQVANITFRYAPLLMSKSSGIVIDQGQATTLTSDDINATGTETFAGSIIIEAANVSHGHFAYANSPNSPITVFQRLAVITGTLQFVQNGSEMVPSFMLRANDGLYTDWQSLPVRLNHRPQLQRDIPAQTVTQDEDFSFLIPNVFHDQDVNDTLSYQAQLAGGAPLPDGVYFSALTRQFSGKLAGTGSFNVEVSAKDGRGLLISTNFILLCQESKAAQYRSAYTSVSSVAGVAIAILAYLWLRRRIAKHRADFPFANDLRLVLNLEYYDFTRFDGDAYKTKVGEFLQRLQLENTDFYKKLAPEARKSFSVCVAEILNDRNLVIRSKYAGGLFGILCCLNVGWPSALKLQEFEDQGSEIASEAVRAWKKEKNPLTHWSYSAPSVKERVGTFFCCPTKRKFSPPTRGIELAQLSSHEGEQKSIGETGFFGGIENKVTSIDARLAAVEEQMSLLGKPSGR